MPRGVYVRKPRGEKPLPKKAVKAAAKVERAEKVKVDAPAPPRAETPRDEPIDDAAYIGTAFQVLGSSLSTLIDAYFRMYENVESKPLAALISVEIRETLGNLSALRRAVFSKVGAVREENEPDAEEVDESPEEEIITPAPPVPVPAAKPTMPVLPQGNANYQPPVPPILPQH